MYRRTSLPFYASSTDSQRMRHSPGKLGGDWNLDGLIGVMAVRVAEEG